jgi:FAD/FMN-containing dehydrogenase
VGWARDLFTALAPFSTGAVYVNFLTAEEGDRVKMAYGANLAKLVGIKKKYDPTNLFRMNINIRPS